MLRLGVILILLANVLHGQEKTSLVVSPEELHASGSLTVEPVQKVDAAYPSEALQRHLEGQVAVRVYISVAGDVERIKLVSGDSTLAAAAVDASRQWKFKTWKYGKYIPLSVWVVLNFDFKLPSGDVLSSKRILVPGSVADFGQRLQLNEDVLRGMYIHKVAPSYPESARRARIEGEVVLHAVIDKEGNVEELDTISGPIALINAAVAAVQQWHYRPYVLNDGPVPFETTITLQFTLRR